MRWVLVLVVVAVIAASGCGIEEPTETLPPLPSQQPDHP